MDKFNTEISHPQAPDTALAGGRLSQPTFEGGFRPSLGVLEAIQSPESEADLFEQVSNGIVQDSLRQIDRLHGPESEDPKPMHRRLHTEQALDAFDEMMRVVRNRLDPRGKNLNLHRQRSIGRAALAKHDLILKNGTKGEGLAQERVRQRGLGPGDNEGASGYAVVEAFNEADELLRKRGSRPVSTETDRQTAKRLVDATLPGAFDGYTLLQDIREDDPIAVQLGVLSDMAITGMDPEMAIFVGMMERRELSFEIENLMRQVGGGIDSKTMNLKNPEGIKNIPPDQLAQIVKVFRNWIANPKMGDHRFDQVGWSAGRLLRVCGFTDEQRQRYNLSLFPSAPEGTPDIRKIRVTQEMVGPDEKGNPRNNLSQAELDQLSRVVQEDLMNGVLNRYEDTVNLALQRKAIALDPVKGTDEQILKMAHFLPSNP